MSGKSAGLKSIDLAKFIFAFFVVGIHVRPFEPYSALANYVFRNVISGLAVPFFFMASCYFFFRKLDFENGKIKKSAENFGRLKKYFLRILLLYVLWTGVYLVWLIPQWIVTDSFSLRTFLSFFKAFLVKWPYYHLWYILCLLYVIPAMYFLLRHINIKAFTVIMAVVYVIGVIYYTYGKLFVPGIIVRLIEFVPIPVGAYLLIMPSVTTCLYVDKCKLRKNTALILFAVCYILFVAESLFFCYNANRSWYVQYAFMIVPTIYFLFVWVKSCNLDISDRTATLLRNMSSVVYFAHPMIINLFGLIIAKEDAERITYFFIISFLSAVTAFVLCKIKEKTNSKILSLFM
ncbi:MAG: acyltransferase [Clostridia bacterium]|nr:acyltransferase [Clostridia bacterium]